jgi:putative Mn2+ efflux pump MntP
MNLFDILFLSLGLSMDAMAVSLCAGAAGFTASLRSSFRIAFHFGLFQAVMPVIGWFAGRTVASIVASFDHWLAFLLLSIVAIRMIRSGLGMRQTVSSCDPTRGSELVMLSLATSIDALAVGFSLALLGVPILSPALLIGLTTFTLSAVAAQLGRRIGLVMGKRMEIVGGGVLFLIGLRIVITHLLGG